jgi:hypothetical protein
MLGHASTHSINFDENTTATTFSFTVIAYQWGWNYFFPREVVDLLATAPKLIGRGRIAHHHQQDRYSALLARARGEYLAQVTLNEVLTARHGRHVISSTLALLTPSFALEAVEAPTWAATSTAAGLLGFSGSGDVRLLSGVPTPHSLHHSTQSRLLWQRYSAARVGGFTPMQPAQAASLVMGAAPALNPELSLVLFTPNTVAAEISTQNLRPLATTVWAGNRLHRIHRYLATMNGPIFANQSAAVTALLHRQANAARGFFSDMGVASSLLAPVTPANLAHQQYSAGAAGAASWAGSNLHTQRPVCALTGAVAQLVHSGAGLPVFSALTLVPGVSAIKAPGSVQLAGLATKVATMSTPIAQNWATATLRYLRGDGVAVVGGEARTLTLSDTPTNSAAAAAEFGLMNGTTPASVGELLARAAGGALSPVSSFIALKGTASTRGLGPSSWLLAPVAGLADAPVSAHAPLRDATMQLGVHVVDVSTLGGVVRLQTNRPAVLGTTFGDGARVGVSGIFNLMQSPAALVAPFSARLTPATPVATSSSLEATSDTLPTRTGAADAGDLVQLNARSASLQGLDATPHAVSELGRWAQSWSWYVVGAGFA